MDKPERSSDSLITYVTDSVCHDVRYAIDATKIKNEFGWEPSLQFEKGIEKTVIWYIDNESWLKNVTSGEYQKFYEDICADRYFLMSTLKQKTLSGITSLAGTQS